MSKGLNFAVILSGCGYLDGSEIHEAVMTLLAVRRNGGAYQCFAPDLDQYHVVDHVTGEEVAQKRNVLKESARIARGKVKPLSEFKEQDFDAILFPGGYGAAKNLCSFAFDGSECKVNADVEKAICSMHAAAKPIGVLCISPVIVAKLLDGVKVTSGQDKDVNAAFEQMGASYENTDHGETVIDHKNKIVSTPCYMLDAEVDQIAQGADNLVKAVIGFIDS